MKKNNKKINTLIKRKNLILKLKKRGIKRANPKAILLLEKWLEQSLNSIIGVLREEMVVQGRKTLKKIDVQEVLKKFRDKEEFWEI